MARISYSVNVTGIHSTTLQSQTIEAIDDELGKTLGGGTTDTTWAGSAIADWAAGVHTPKQSRTSSNTVTVGAGADGLWVKNTGTSYADTSIAENATVVTVTGGTDLICKLAAGQAIFLPSPKAQTITFTDDAAGVAVAVEYAVLT